MTRLLFIAFLFFISAATSAAETVNYVSDNLVVMMRSGPGNQYKIIRTLPSGTRLKVVEASEDNDHSLVRTDSGVEGWVLTQYLVDTPVARTRLAEVESRLAKTSQENEALKTELASTKSQFQSIQSERNQLDNQSDKLQTELEQLHKVAAKPLELDRENRELKEELISTKNELRITQEKNHVLEDSSERQWFAIGAMVLLAGMVLGLIIPKIRWRKRTMWSDL